jgi:hypothetical protein
VEWSAEACTIVRRHDQGPNRSDKQALECMGPKYMCTCPKRTNARFGGFVVLVSVGCHTMLRNTLGSGMAYRPRGSFSGTYRCVSKCCVPHLRDISEVERRCSWQDVRCSFKGLVGHACTSEMPRFPRPRRFRAGIAVVPDTQTSWHPT